MMNGWDLLRCAIVCAASLALPASWAVVLYLHIQNEIADSENARQLGERSSRMVDQIIDRQSK
jgi:hypothetical protein